MTKNAIHTQIPDETFIRFLEPVLEKADPAHDLQHVRRVVNNAMRISEGEDADFEIVRTTAWLHDCVILPKNHPNRSRASHLAAEEAGRFLKKQGCLTDFNESVMHAVEAHSFSANITPRTIEAKVVQDADRIDALGATGLARCFMTGGAMGSGLAHPHTPFPENREADDKSWCVDHFYTKLLKLHQTMQTETGRKIAIERTKILENWLEEFRVEVGV